MRPPASVPGARNRRLDIQGLRAVAVLMVVAFHAGLPVPGGYVGVDVFFVISGFVITAMLMREWESTGRIRLGRFYVRRFKRLTPALAVTVGVVMLASFLLLSPFGSQQTAAKTAIGALLLAANVVIARTTGDYFDAPAESNPLLNMWSLSVEEQFYLVFPAVLLLGWLWGKRSRRPELVPVVLVVLVGVVSFVLAMVGSVGVELPLVPEVLVGFYGPATRAWEFAVGALLALGGARLAVSSPRVALPLALVGAGMLAASLWLITDTTPFPGVWTLLPVVGTLLLLVAGPVDTVIARALASRPMIAVGDRSYSIYLWHWPFIVFAHLLWPGVPGALVVAAALSIIPAYASYRWVEEPIRALPDLAGWPLIRLVAAMVLPPLALAGTLGFSASNGYWNSTVQKYQTAIEKQHLGEAADCTRQAWRNPAKCTWNGHSSGRPIYLVGDSNADSLSEALLATAKASSRPLVGLSESGCHFIPASFGMEDQAWEDRCNVYQSSTARYLVAAEPGLVVIANSYLWWRDSSEVAIGAPGKPPSMDRETKLQALSIALTASVSSLQNAGHTVMLVQAVPHWGDSMTSLSWTGCSLLDMVTVACGHTMSVKDVLERQGATADAVVGVAQLNGVGLLDVTAELCPDATCTSVAPDGLVRYQDGTHITVDQSEALRGAFTEAVSAAG